MSLSSEHQLQVGLTKRLGIVLCKEFGPLLFFWLDCSSSVCKSREHAERDASSLGFELPENTFVAICDHFNVVSRRFELLWDWHVDKNFEGLDPWGKTIVLLQKRQQIQLVGDVENFANLVNDGKRSLALELAHVLLHEGTKRAHALLHDFQKRLPGVVELVLVLFG